MPRSKKSKRKEKPHKEQQPRKQKDIQKPQSKFSFLWHRFFAIIGPIATIFSFVSLYYTFSPNIVVEPLYFAEKTEPFTSPFKISNVGLLDMHEVDIYFNSNEITALGHMYGKLFVKNYEYHLYPAVKKLKAGHSLTEYLKYEFGPVWEIKNGDVQISITYKLSYFPKTFFHKFCFKTYIHKDKTVRWVDMPCPENY